MRSLHKAVACAAFGAFVSVTVLAALPVQAATDTVVAIVNGEKILKKDVDSAIKQLPVKDADKDAVFPQVVEQMVNEKLLEDATVAAKIAESKEYKERLDIMKTQLVKQLYLEKFMSDKLSESKVKAEYDKFKKENKGKEEIRARHILVPSVEEAEQVIKDLDAGQDFAELARKRSSGPSAQTGGDLGYFTREDMVEEFSKAAFALKKGQYTKKPVKSQFGYHVILVEDKRKREVPELAAVEMAIRNKLGQEAMQKLITDLRAKAEIQLFDAKGNPVKETGAN